MAGVVCDHLHVQVERRAICALRADIAANKKEIDKLDKRNPMRRALEKINHRKRHELMHRSIKLEKGL